MPASIDSIYCTGGDYVGSTIGFHSVTKGANSYLWDFGDKRTSTDSAPNHSYSAPGKYWISLTINDDRGLSKEIHVNIAQYASSVKYSKFTYLLNGNWPCRHIWGRAFSSGFRDTTWKPNVTLNITAIDAATILVGGDTLYCSSVSADDSVSIYETITPTSYGRYMDKTVYFIHHNTADTVSYMIWNDISAGGAEYDDYFYP